MSLSEKDNKALEAAVEYAVSHGALVGDSSSATGTSHVPFSLFPTPFPERSFDAAMKAAEPFGTLVDRVAADAAFLGAHLAQAAAGDEFTRRLLDLYERTFEETESDPRLGIHRSDYMLRHDAATTEGSGLVQIELNTISCAFAALGTRVVEMHRDLAQRGLVPGAAGEDAIPASRALEGVAAGIAEACALAGGEPATTDAENSTPPAAVVVMVVQPGEKNSFDQSILASRLETAHGVRTLRRSLADMSPGGRTPVSVNDEQGRSLWIDDDAGARVRVGVVYFRAGYTPRDYPTEAEWTARYELERSSACKCPSVGYQLAGTKKVQQVLAVAGVLDAFLPDPAERDAVRATFAGLWPLDGDPAAVEAIKARVLADPHAFVLKPQREGGGNNMYDDDMVRAIGTMPRSELEAHIIMERVFPPETPATIVRRGTAKVVDRCVSELGVFSVYLASGVVEGDEENKDSKKTKKVVHTNLAAGYILRTKSAADADGGVAAGVAVMDSVLLTK